MSTQSYPGSASSGYITSKEDGQPISQTVLEAVAELSGRAVIPDASPPKDDESRPLPPLYEAIDPDALNTISQSATDETEITVTFTYCGFEVTIKNGDEVIVCEK
ncbi:HalOD1 output domain-containing protein [Halovenus sp. HT40]|uniref:HalOD1 output domain-containing protein n=1 Tax=Halovenus sp. HT40 TaxID=3126691 RepID=UPI00300F204A